MNMCLIIAHMLLRMKTFLFIIHFFLSLFDIKNIYSLSQKIIDTNQTLECIPYFVVL